MFLNGGKDVDGMVMICKLCGKNMNSMDEYVRHVMMECKQVPRTRKCPVCGRRFNTIHKFKVHLMNEALIDARHGNALVQLQ